MAKIRVTKIFTFEMAHALWGYDGKCKNIHGHTYSLYVTIIGEPEQDFKSPKNGMVIDFTYLKKLIYNSIIDEFDHSLVLNANSPHKSIKSNTAGLEKIILVPYQPTCENLLIDFAARLNKLFTDKIKLYSLKLSETPSTFAEWLASDNT